MSVVRGETSRCCLAAVIPPWTNLRADLDEDACSPAIGHASKKLVWSLAIKVESRYEVSG
jgi:hypothetical protein